MSSSLQALEAQQDRSSQTFSPNHRRIYKGKSFKQAGRDGDRL